MNAPRPDIARNVLSVIFILGLILGSLWILLPFLGALIWATTIVVTTWPVLVWLQGKLWGKRGPAVAVLTVVLLGVVFVPFLAAVGTIVGNVDDVAARAKALAAIEVPPVAPMGPEGPPSRRQPGDVLGEVRRSGAQGRRRGRRSVRGVGREVVRGEGRRDRPLAPPLPHDGRRLRGLMVERGGSWPPRPALRATARRRPGRRVRDPPGGPGRSAASPSGSSSRPSSSRCSAGSAFCHGSARSPRSLTAVDVHAGHRAGRSDPRARRRSRLRFIGRAIPSGGGLPPVLDPRRRAHGQFPPAPT